MAAPALYTLYFILYFILYTLGLDFLSICTFSPDGVFGVTASCFEFSLKECSASCLL